MDSATARRDYNSGRKLPQRSSADDGFVRTAPTGGSTSGDIRYVDVVPCSSSISPPLPPLIPLPPHSTSTTYIYRNLSDVIASHAAATSGGTRSAPRHADVTPFTPSRPVVTNSESGLPNFIDTFYSATTSAAAATGAHAQAVVSLTHDASSPSTASCGGSGIWSSPSHSTITVQSTVDDVIRHHHGAQQHHHSHPHHHQQHHHPHQNHQQPPHPFFSSTISDRPLHPVVQLIADNDDDGDDFFRDASMSHAMEPSVMDDGTDGVNGFLMTGPDSFQDMWGLGLRLFETAGGGGGVYDDDMPPLESINSTPEQEGVRKIQNVCSKLGIGSEPMKWSTHEVNKWLYWVLHKHYSPSVTLSNRADDLDGVQLCRLGLRELEHRFGSDAEYVLTELEQWKQLGALAAGGDNGLLLATSGGVTSFAGRHADMNYTTLSSAANQHEQLIFAINNNNNADRDNNNNNNHGSSFHGCTLAQCLTQRRQPDAHRCHNQPSIYHPDTVLDSLCSSATWDAPFVGGHLSQVCDSVPSTMRTAPTATYIKTELSTSRDDFRSPDDSLLYCTSTTANYDDLDLQSSAYKPWPESSSAAMQSTNYRASSHQSRGGRGSTKRTICLWQFLRELLLTPNYQTWIRWIDRNKGIFKIEDSVRVAKLWGERKNRPAMNYDKLSRSIRQYYRKGIIQKTSNSKRLVYQFCPEYMT